MAEREEEPFDEQEALNEIRYRGGCVGYAMLPCRGQRVMHLSFENDTHVPIQKFPLTVLEMLMKTDFDLARAYHQLVTQSMQIHSLASELHYVTDTLLVNHRKRFAVVSKQLRDAHEVVMASSGKIKSNDLIKENADLADQLRMAQQRVEELEAQEEVRTMRLRAALPTVADIRKLIEYLLPCGNDLAEHSDPLVSTHFKVSTEAFYRINELVSQLTRVFDKLPLDDSPP